MVALLIAVICENANEKKEEIREIRNEIPNEESYEELSNDKNFDDDAILFDSSSSNTDKLAQKFAKDALKSSKVQETINKLTNIGGSRNYLDKMSQHPEREYAVQKPRMHSTRSKAVGHENRKKKKERKRHKHRHRRKRLRNRRPRWSKKRPAKVDSDFSEEQNTVKMKIHAWEPSSNSKKIKSKVIRTNISKDKKSLIDNMTFINLDNINVEDYIDLTQSTNSNIDANTISMKTDKTKTMVERSMSAVTKNPKKKNPDDREVEHSDYYNDIDGLNEERKLKGKRKHPRARSVRQSFTVSPSNRKSDDYIYIPNDNVENNPDIKYFEENTNNFENHLSNYNSLTPVQANDANDNSLNLQIDKEQRILPNELEPRMSYDSMRLPIDQVKNLRPAEINENFIPGVSNFAFSKLDQNERPPLVGQENSINTDTNPPILQSNEHQYTLPIGNDNINLYNNHAYNSGQEGKIQYPIEDYLNNYGTYLQNQDEKYTYPINQDSSEIRLKDQPQLSEINRNIENTIELKNPTNIYSKQYERIFAQPQDQGLLRYLPMHRNTYRGDRLLLVNSSNVQSDKSNTNLRDSINTNANEPFRKISDVPPSHEYVQPLERFPNSYHFEPEETLRKQDDANNLMNQQIVRRGLQKGFANSGNLKELNEREFAKRRKNAIVRNRYSVEEDVAKSQRIDIAATVNETKEVADQILNRIVDELEEIKMDHSKDNKNSEGFPCKVTGSWVTRKAGVRIDIKLVNHSILVTLANLIPQPMYAGLINTTWNVTGHAPFKRGGPFSLSAYDNCTKTLAVFVGSCRVCQGIDTIEGIWSVAREPRDCRDFRMATEIFSDIFRKTKLLSAIKEKKKAILQGMLMRNVKNITSYNDVRKNKNDQK